MGIDDKYTFSISNAELKLLSRVFLGIQTYRPQSSMDYFLDFNEKRLRLNDGELLKKILKYIEQEKYISFLTTEEKTQFKEEDDYFLDDFFKDLFHPIVIRQNDKKQVSQKKIKIRWR